MDGLLADTRRRFKGLLTDVENFSIGAGHGISNQLDGLYQMAAHPVESAKALYGAGKAVVNDPSIVGGLLKDAYSQATSGPLGMGLLVGENMSLRPRAPKSLLELTTYHGSPHRINNVAPDAPYGRFDLSKVGTGEGAQAYGHGIYLAENPGVAKSYKYAGADGYFTLDGAPPRPKADPLGAGRDLAVAYDDAAAKAKSLGLDPAISYYEDQIKFFPQYADEYARPLEQLRTMKAAGAKTTPIGHFYTVDLPDEHIEKMLDWDAPLSEQPEAVRKAFLEVSSQYVPFKKQDAIGGWDLVDKDSGQLMGLAFGSEKGALDYLGKGVKGQDVYESFARRMAGPSMDGQIGQRKASEHLRSLGIPGIKYFDGGSRAAGEGTRNFVIFDPDVAKILKRE